ncbi:hypothetical protein [Mucilaginibacter auburnensis]|uniref:Lipocalin-like protein n=1 Tax=Mucilaginibacter auburnensis TaxID=1457233 RepID=A0A2H9VN29_9SPHI|nr:hypothetical protein [Mucilaginibacter auburnensis]PJJ79728.1 hypothetical protein CLV57_2865 [Mucilaginibacter auburnensis]
MKRIFQLTFTVLAVAIILQACSTTKSVVGTNNGPLRGTWTLTNVSYEGLVPGAVQNVFDQASPASFVNSTWELPNNGNGKYTLSNGTSQSIFWSYNNADKANPIFQFKKIYEGEKANKIAEGYQLNVAQVDDTSMTLKSPVANGSKTAYIVYTFRKQ